MQGQTDSVNVNGVPSSNSQSLMSRTSVAAHGAAKVFREFKWGLLTLFLLMVVVISLIYDGGKKDSEVVVTQANNTSEVNSEAPGSNLLAAEDQPPSTVPAGETQSPIQRFNQRNRTDDPRGYQGETTQRPVDYPGFSNAGEAQALPRVPGPPQYQPPASNPSLSPDAVRSGNITENSSNWNQWGNNSSATEARYLNGGVTPPQRRTAIRNQIPPRSGSRLTANYYVVKSGDTLSGIAQRYYPGKVRAGTKLLAAANKNLFSDPRRMRVGMKLVIPVDAAASNRGINQNPTGSSQANTETRIASNYGNTVQLAPDSVGSGNRLPLVRAANIYVVQPGDTLAQIAKIKLNDSRRWREIYQWNKGELKNPSLLRVGQKLKILDSPKPKRTDKESRRSSVGKKRMVVSNEPTEEEVPLTSTNQVAPVWMP